MTIRLRQIAIGYLSQKSALLLTALKSYVYELGRPTIAAAVQTEQVGISAVVVKAQKVQPILLRH